METVLTYKTEKQSEIKAILDKDEYRQLSGEFKDPKPLGFEEEEGTWYLHLEAGDEALAKKFEGEAGDLVSQAEKKGEVLAKLESQELPDGAGSFFDV